MTWVSFIEEKKFHSCVQNDNDSAAALSVQVKWWYLSFKLNQPVSVGTWSRWLVPIGCQLGGSGGPALVLSLLAHSSFTSLQEEFIGRQWCAKRRSSWTKCSLNRWPSREPNGSWLKWGAGVGRRDIRVHRERDLTCVVNWGGVNGGTRWCLHHWLVDQKARQRYPEVGWPLQH